jgi:hypothetical protein
MPEWPRSKRVDADAQHRAHHVRRERLADTDRNRHDQVVLQFDVQRPARRSAPGSPSRYRTRAKQLVGIAAEAVETPRWFFAAHLFGEKAAARATASAILASSSTLAPRATQPAAPRQRSVRSSLTS